MFYLVLAAAFCAWSRRYFFINLCNRRNLRIWSDSHRLLYCRCSPRWASGPDASHPDSFFGQTNRLSEGFVAVNMTVD
jgi:hypothetical protein